MAIKRFLQLQGIRFLKYFCLSNFAVPIEMEMMKREHFNRWYNLVPYFLSVVTFEIPFQVSNDNLQKL